jgi:PadR family transcriptional regulator PadR
MSRIGSSRIGTTFSRILTLAPMGWIIPSSLTMEAKPETRTEIPPGTLYLLILRILSRQRMHGYGIAQRIQQISEEILRVEEGSLYPALQRMLIKGWVKAEWGQSENNRRARYYSLTPAGRKQLSLEISQFDRVTQAIVRVIQLA